MTTLDPMFRSVLDAYFAAVNARDEVAMMGLLAPEPVYFGSLGGVTLSGRDPLVGVLRAVGGRWADFRQTPGPTYGHGPEVAMIGVLSADGYEMPRLSTFCGRPMRHSGWYPDYVLRLFRCGRARFSDDLVHERVICKGKVARLNEPLTHHPVARLEDSLSRMDRYSTARAEMIVNSGRRVSFFTGILRGWWTFIQTYFIRLGFLDGREGFLLAIANAEGTYYRYMKAWLKGRDRG